MLKMEARYYYNTVVLKLNSVFPLVGP
jgi:hypothetical protein